MSTNETLGSFQRKRKEDQETGETVHLWNNSSVGDREIQELWAHISSNRRISESTTNSIKSESNFVVIYYNDETQMVSPKVVVQGSACVPQYFDYFKDRDLNRKAEVLAIIGKELFLNKKRLTENIEAISDGEMDQTSLQIVLMNFRIIITKLMGEIPNGSQVYNYCSEALQTINNKVDLSRPDQKVLSKLNQNFQRILELLSGE